jgi:hypothetical protein
MSTDQSPPLTIRESVRVVAPTNPHGALLFVIRIIRSREQKEVATNDGVFTSYEAWTQLFGEPTAEKVFLLVDHLGAMADEVLPRAWVIEVLESMHETD